MLSGSSVIKFPDSLVCISGHNFIQEQDMKMKVSQLENDQQKILVLKDDAVVCCMFNVPVLVGHRCFAKQPYP